MRKRYLCLGLAAVLICLLYSGCGKQVQPATEPTEPMETEPTQAQLMPVDESVFYFSNELEYCRLYSQRLDGTDLKLVQDTYCYHVRQEGDTVYYLDGEDLCAYHIPTGVNSVLVENAFDYAVENHHLVYYLDLEEAFKTEIRYRNLETGEEVSLGEIFNSGNCDLANGILYYTKYEQEYGNGQLCVCDLATFETKTIANELTSFHQLRAVSDGVYFEGIGADYTFAQYFASADGSVLRKIEAGLTSNCQMFHESDRGVLCVCTSYDESGSKSCIHRHNPDGSITDMLYGRDGGYFAVEPIRKNQWLLTHTYYDGWSSSDANGEYENFVYRLEYYLIDEDGSITAIEAEGELGSLFANGDFPVMDSSTARKPLTADIYNVFVANHGHEGAKPLCSTTHGAWLNIADRKVDIALLAAPTKEETDYLNERGVTIEMKLYGGDGLVFIGNSANPVQNLTHEQIIAIYQGNIKNWSEVGGPDVPISVYYRDDQSGSQRLFEKMVFKGLEPPDYENLGFWYMDEMSTIVEIVMDDPYAIGYSIMTYLDDVYSNEALKVFAVNGVEPSVDTVKNSTYPYHTQGYVVIRSDEPVGSPARRLYDWFGTKVCDEMLVACGITPLHGGGVG